jgi:hypothetical protein
MKLRTFAFGSGSQAKFSAHSVTNSTTNSVSCESSARRSLETRTDRFTALLKDSPVDLEALRNISWAGIPAVYRAATWRLFLDYEPVNASNRLSTLKHKRNEYFDSVNRIFDGNRRDMWTAIQRAAHSQILRDLPRTSHSLLRTERVQLLFERVLFIWSVRHPATGYVQGMSDLLQPFFFVFLTPYCSDQNIGSVIALSDLNWLEEDLIREIEADCYWCFSKLLNGLHDLYTPGQPGLSHMLSLLSSVIDRVCPSLAAHIRNEEIHYHEFAFRWINCLLVRELPMNCLLRVWDSYLANAMKIPTMHVYICAAVLIEMSSKLVDMSHAEFVLQAQTVHQENWSMNEMELIIAQAFVFESLFSGSSHLKFGKEWIHQ